MFDNQSPTFIWVVEKAIERSPENQIILIRNNKYSTDFKMWGILTLRGHPLRKYKSTYGLFEKTLFMFKVLLLLDICNV